MPCYSITTVSLVLLNADLTALEKAVRKHIQYPNNMNSFDGGLVWNGGSYDKETGRLEVNSEKEGQLIKREYSAELVRMQAKRFGWSIKETSEFKFQIIKR